MKLGLLEVGETGFKGFGKFCLCWEVNIDHLQWSLNEIEDPQKSWLTGALKYVGWNRIEVASEMSLEEQLQNKQSNSLAATPNFEVYVHEWPSIKEALDFLYYDLGAKISAGTYEKSLQNCDMIFEHFIHTDGSFTFQPEGTKPIVEDGENLQLCCKIEAASWEEAMQKYHQHMGWEPYICFDL